MGSTTHPANWRGQHRPVLIPAGGLGSGAQSYPRLQEFKASLGYAETLFQKQKQKK